jgi:hypothetical protein
MSDEPKIEEIDLAHVAALSMAIWIYLIKQDDKAVEVIADMAAKLHAEMTITGETNEEG